MTSDQPANHDREREALEALIVAALRTGEDAEPTFERLQALAADLSEDDRAALEASAPDLVDAVLARCARSAVERDAGEIGRAERGRASNGAGDGAFPAPAVAGGGRRTEGRSGSERHGDGRRERGRNVHRGRERGRDRHGRQENRRQGHGRPGRRRPEQGAKLMKSLLVSGAVLVAVVGAFFFLRAGRLDGTPASASRERTADLVARLDERLERLEERLRDLDALDSRVSLLAERVAGRGSGSGAGAGVAHGGAGATGEEGEGRADPVPADAAAAPGREEVLRTFVRDVIEKERAERQAAERRRAEERAQEIAALHEGPYGEHNFKVNSTAKRLGLSDSQAQHYYSNLVTYNALIAETRELESADPENREAYRSRRSDLRREFSNVVGSVMTLEQSELYAQLPEFQQRPDGGTANVTWGFSTIQTVGAAPGDFELRVLPSVQGGALDHVEKARVRVELEAVEEQVEAEKARLEAEQARDTAYRAARELEAATRELEAAEEEASRR